MSYWASDNVIRIGEEQVSIPSENGLSYECGQNGRRVQLFIPPSVKFLSGKDSYLQFDLKINQPADCHTRLQLDPAGAGMCIRNLRIYDGSRGNLIEEINEYNQLVALRYDYDADDSLRKTRAMMEGGTSYQHKNAGTEGTSKSDVSDTYTNPYFKQSTTSAKTTDYDPAAENNTVKCSVPIYAGCFQGSIFPNMMTNGLYMEIDLMPAARIIKQLDSVLESRRRPLNPFFAINGSVGGGDWTAGVPGNTDRIILETKNYVNSVTSTPFVVGESVGFAKNDGLNASQFGVFSADLIIDEISASANGSMFIKFDAAAENNTGVTIDQTFVMYSKEIKDKATDLVISYTISNFTLVATSITLDPAYERGMLAKAREGKAIEFDIHSVSNYKNSLLASERQATFLINAQNSRAKSLVVIPTDSTVYTNNQLISASGTYVVTQDDMDTRLASARSGLCGICDGLSSVQYQIDGKLVPSRPISTSKIASGESVDAFHLYELEKTLMNAKIQPRSFTKYMENFVIGRSFGVNNGAMDLRGKDLSVILDYSEAAAPTKPKLFNSFVFHVRKLTLRNGNVIVTM